MKKKIVVLFVASLFAAQVPAVETIARWSFNSDPVDGLPPTGTYIPAEGRGRMTFIGGVTGRFTAGDTDFAAADNSALATTSYPPQSTGNKTAGVRFQVSTLGYYNITISLRLGGNEIASAVTRLQYSGDGSNFVDSILMIWSPTLPFTPFSANYSSNRSTEDNPNFAFQVVTELFSPLDGSQVPPYYRTYTKHPYSPLGTLRFDEVVVTGLPMSSDPPPVLVAPSSLITEPNVSLTNVMIQVHDTNTPADQLYVSVQSSNEELLPQANITLLGTSTNRLLHLVPTLNQIGSSILHLTVINAKGRTTTRRIPFEVRAGGSNPTLSPIPPQITAMNTPIEVPLELLQYDEQALPLIFQAASSYPALVPPAHFSFVGAGASHKVVLAPASNLVGNSCITLVVTDKYRRKSTNTFLLMVQPTPALEICDPFEYGPGTLVTNSQGYWRTHSGTAGQIPIFEGQPHLSSNGSEDVHVPLPNGPFATDSGINLYAGLTLVASLLPSNAGQYFAHFNHSGFRGRLFVGTQGLPFGCYRIGIANNSTTVTWATQECVMRRSYRIITRYNVGTGESVFWINARAESDEFTAATDAPAPTSIVSFGLRQNSGIGTLIVDDLKVGTSFDAVAAAFPPQLLMTTYGRETETSWPVNLTGYLLEWTDELPTGNWRPLEGEPSIGLHRRFLVSAPSTNGMRFFRLRATNDPPTALPPGEPKNF